MLGNLGSREGFEVVHDFVVGHLNWLRLSAGHRVSPGLGFVSDVSMVGTWPVGVQPHLNKSFEIVG